MQLSRIQAGESRALGAEADQAAGLIACPLENVDPHRAILTALRQFRSETTPSIGWMWRYSSITDFHSRLIYLIRAC